VARADDTPEAVQGRLRDYHDKIRPVLELFEAKEVIVAVDATGPVAQVQAAIHDSWGSRRRPPDRSKAQRASPSGAATRAPRTPPALRHSE
jgi:hypothetical protein